MPRRLESVRSAFEAELDDALDFFQRGTTAIDKGTGRAVFTRQQKIIITEAAFLLGCVAWERFLEHAFAHYVIGERAPSGYRPRRIMILRATFPLARKTLGGDRDFVGWIDPGTVRSRAEKWFDNGEPFVTPLSGTGTLLNYLHKMRNVVAHDSGSALTTFEKATRSLYGAAPSDLSAGKQLLAPCPPALGAGGDLFSTAFASYRVVASQIVP